MNLSEIKTRDLEQEKQIGRRSSIISGRRDTNAPDLRPAGDMRSARRGDTGGAEALMRTLGLAQQAGSDFQQYAQQKHAVDEQDNIARGYADEAAGLVDGAAMERSLGYRNAVTKGRTVTEFTKATQGLAQQLDEIIEQQDSPILEDRQAMVTSMVEDFYKNFATDPETGQLREYLQSPGAMRYLAAAIQESRPQFLAKAQERIEERFNDEALSHFSTHIGQQALQTGTVDLAEARTLLPATVTSEQVAETTLVAVNNAVQALRDNGRFEEATRLIGSLRRRMKQPVEADVGEAAPSGTAELAAPTETPAAPANGRVSYNVLRDAVEHFESRGNPNAVSPAGAVGRMQTMPGTLRDPGYGVRPARDNSDAELTRVGNDYLKAMLREYNGDLVLALAAYNWGPGRVDDWKAQVAGKSMSAKIAAIPVKETRDYVRNILTRAGALSGTAAAAAPAAAASTEPPPVPEYRLTDLNEDPITRTERESFDLIPGLEGITFSAAQMARIDEIYDVTTNEMRREYRVKQSEEQAENGTRLALGLLGVGGMTTRQDILDAREGGQIDDDTMLALLRSQEAQREAAENQRDRELARQDRQTALNQRKAAEAAIGGLVGSLARGEASAAEIRHAAIRLMPTLDPAIAGDVLSSANAIANGYESALANSAPARRHSESWNEQVTNLPARIAKWNVIPSQRKNVQALAEAAIEAGQAKFLQRVIEGEDPDTVAAEINRQIVNRHAELVVQYGVQR